jgi:hypothetical protein
LTTKFYIRQIKILTEGTAAPVYAIVAVVGELEPAGRLQHVGMNGKENFAAAPALATMR